MCDAGRPRPAASGWGRPPSALTAPWGLRPFPRGQRAVRSAGACWAPGSLASCSAPPSRPPACCLAAKLAGAREGRPLPSSSLSLHQSTAGRVLVSQWGRGLWRQNRPGWAPAPTALWGQACGCPWAAVPICKVEGPRARPAGREVRSTLAGGTVIESSRGFPSQPSTGSGPEAPPRRARHRRRGLTPAAPRSPALYETVLTPAHAPPPRAPAGARPAPGRPLAGERWAVGASWCLSSRLCP